MIKHRKIHFKKEDTKTRLLLGHGMNDFDLIRERLLLV
jgi:hypothetical protein